MGMLDSRSSLTLQSTRDEDSRDSPSLSVSKSFIAVYARSSSRLLRYLLHLPSSPPKQKKISDNEGRRQQALHLEAAQAANRRLGQDGPSLWLRHRMWPWRGRRHRGRSVFPLPTFLPSFLETTCTNSLSVKKIWDASMHLLRWLKENSPLPCPALPCQQLGRLLCVHALAMLFRCPNTISGWISQIEKLCGFRVRCPELGVWSFIPRTTITHISSTCRVGERLKEKGTSVEFSSYGDNGKCPRFSFYVWLRNFEIQDLPWAMDVRGRSN